MTIKGDAVKEINILKGDVPITKPNFSIKAHGTVRLEGIGTALTGLYYVEESKIIVETGKGITQDLKVSRNGFTDTIKDNNAGGGGSPTKPPVKETPKKPTPPKKATTHTVKKGETLSSISKKYYGKATLWNKIYNANKNKIKNPNLIYVGWKLTIP